MRIAVTAAVLAFAAACTPSDRAEFGGVANGAALNGPVISCEESGVLLEERGPLTYPSQLLAVAYFAQSDGMRVEIPFRFDVTRAGEVVNLEFTGDEELTRSRGGREAIANAADSLLNSRFSWPQRATAEYAAGCRETINFSTRFSARP